MDLDGVIVVGVVFMFVIRCFFSALAVVDFFSRSLSVIGSVFFLSAT